MKRQLTIGDQKENICGTVEFDNETQYLEIWYLEEGANGEKMIHIDVKESPYTIKGKKTIPFSVMPKLKK